MNLIEWYLSLALRCGASSWSMEEVPHPEVLAIVEAMRCQHRNKISYHVFNFTELGVPQTRKRLLAGSPHLIAKLLRECVTQTPRSVQDVISAPRGTHIRNRNYSISRKRKRSTEPGKAKFKYTKATWTDHCHAINGPAPTVLAGTSLWWITMDGKRFERTLLRTSDSATLQTFPPSYKFPEGRAKALLQIGNAVPPRVAELMLRTRQPLRVMDFAEGMRCSSPSLMR